MNYYKNKNRLEINNFLESSKNANRVNKVKGVLFGLGDKHNTFCVMSPENPKNTKLSREDNIERQKHFRHELNKRGISFTPIKGVYDGKKEHSFFLYDISVETSKELASMFEQESFFHGSVNKDNNADVTYYVWIKNNYLPVETSSNINTEQDRDDFYSIVGNDFKFSFDMNYFMENLKLLRESINSEEIKTFIDDLYKLRKDSVKDEGEFGLGNLVFKEFRNRGYLDKLKTLAKDLRGKELSLENLNLNEEETVQEYTFLGSISNFNNVCEEIEKVYSMDTIKNSVFDIIKHRYEKITFHEGYLVSFMTDGITSEEYKNTFNIFNSFIEDEHFVQYIKGTPKVVFKISDRLTALKIAKLYNQQYIWNCEKDKALVNLKFEENKKIDYSEADYELKKLLNVLVDSEEQEKK